MQYSIYISMTPLTYQLIVEPRVQCNILNKSQLPMASVNTSNVICKMIATYLDSIFLSILKFACPRNAPSIVNPVNYEETKLYNHTTP